jgi:hypothetical protein
MTPIKGAGGKEQQITLERKPHDMDKKAKAFFFSKLFMNRNLAMKTEMNKLRKAWIKVSLWR